MDLNTIFSIINAVGSLATAVTILFLIQQRKDSIKPIIVVEYTNKYYKFRDNEYFLEVGTNQFKEERPYFSIINPGNGLAVNITVKPLLDLSKLINYLKQADISNLYYIEIRNNFLVLKKKSDSTEKPFNLGSITPWKTSALIDMKTDSTKRYDIKQNQRFLVFIAAVEMIKKENNDSAYSLKIFH